MEEIRIENLSLGEEYMSDGLIGQIDLFKQFVDDIYPNICILCSDKRLKSVIDKLYIDYPDVNITVYGTFEEDIESIAKTARYADAVIVNTLALKIAPKGLFDTLMLLSPLKKVCYFILSGWESLPKDASLAKKKVKQTDIEFEFVNIVSCKNAYDKPAEGFQSTEDILSEYIQSINAAYRNLHKQQTEILYRLHMQDVKAFRDTLCDKIIYEIGYVKQIQDIIWKKENQYSITFTHVSVRISEIVDIINKKMAHIHGNDILSKLQEDSNLEQEFCEQQELFETKAKEKILEILKDEISNFMQRSDSLLSSQTTMKVTECINDLLSSIERLRKCQFIEEYDFQDVIECVNQSDILERTGTISQDGMRDAFQQVQDALSTKIMTFNFVYEENKVADMVTSGLATVQSKLEKKEKEKQEKKKEQERVRMEQDKNPILRAKNVIKDIFDTPDYNEENEGKVLGLNPEEQINTLENTVKYVEGTSQVAESNRKWQRFQNEINRLAEFGKSELSDLLYNSMSFVNEEINIQSSESIREYFSSISAKLDKITENMKNILQKYED